MGILSSKPFVVIDLGSGRYVQTKVGHEYYNLIESSDGRYYGYCPPHDNIDISNLGAKSSDSSICKIKLYNYILYHIFILNTVACRNWMCKSASF